MRADLVHPFLGRMVRRVGGAGRVVDHERPVGLDLVQHPDAPDRLVGHRGDQVPAGMAEIGLDRRGVAEQVVRLPLAGVVADEAVVVVEALDRPGRPVGERAGLARHPLRHVVVLAVPRGVVAVLPQDLADGDGVARDHAVVAGIAGRLIDDDAGGHRMVVVAGEQRGPRRRAERRGVERGCSAGPCSATRSRAGVGITPPKVDGAQKPTSSVMISRMFGAPLGGDDQRRPSTASTARRWARSRRRRLRRRRQVSAVDGGRRAGRARRAGDLLRRGRPGRQQGRDRQPRYPQWQRSPCHWTPLTDSWIAHG